MRRRPVWRGRAGALVTCGLGVRFGATPEFEAVLDKPKPFTYRQISSKAVRVVDHGWIFETHPQPDKVRWSVQQDPEKWA